MATALIDRSFSESYDLYLYNPTMEKAEKLQSLVGGKVVSELVSLSDIDIIFLGFKPQHFKEAVEIYRENLVSNPQVIPVLAGISLSKLEDSFSSNKVFRLMPNTPSEIGEGVITYVCSEEITESEYSFFKESFSSKATLFKLSTDLEIDQSTPVTGSAPAFIFEYAKHMQKYLEKSGFTEDMAKMMVIKTFVGSSKLMESSEKNLGELVTQVTSKGGVTERGLEILSNGKFEQLVEECLNGSFEKINDLKD